MLCKSNGRPLPSSMPASLGLSLYLDESCLGRIVEVMTSSIRPKLGMTGVRWGYDQPLASDHRQSQLHSPRQQRLLGRLACTGKKKGNRADACPQKLVIAINCLSTGRLLGGTSLPVASRPWTAVSKLAVSQARATGGRLSLLHNSYGPLSKVSPSQHPILLPAGRPYAVKRESHCIHSGRVAAITNRC